MKPSAANYFSRISNLFSIVSSLFALCNDVGISFPLRFKLVQGGRICTMHTFSPHKPKPDLLICEFSRQKGVMDKVLNANYVVSNTHTAWGNVTSVFQNNTLNQLRGCMCDWGMNGILKRIFNVSLPSHALTKVRISANIRVEAVCIVYQ